MLKTHGCGELRAEHAGQRIRLAGWVNAHRDHGGVLFVDLRDSTGLVQVVFEQALPEAHRLRDEWCVCVEGPVRMRPEGTVNDKIPTGRIEVVAEGLEVLNAAKPLPFPIEDHLDAEEVTRLHYRYLDLRREPMRHALWMRARAVRAMRRWLDDRGFLEVETPILGKTTPEGARDFLVPSRLHPGTFYALLQSPQILKQTLMASGVERYYQFAKCLRDEDLRADRQPEHTQLDLEMAFVERDDVHAVMEGVMQAVWRECLGTELAIPFPKLPYAEAMDRYGTDKPDLRAGPSIADLSAVFEGTEFKAFADVVSSGGAIRGLRVPGAGGMSRARRDALIERAKELGAKGLVWMIVEPDELQAPIAKFLSETEIKAIRTGLEAEAGDLLLLVAGDPRMASVVLGTLRAEQAYEHGRLRTASDPPDWRFVWVTDFPLFEWIDERHGWDPAHNAFSMPAPGWEELIDTDPAACGSLVYDLVLNGVELATGSIRIHKPEIQLKVLEKIGVPEEEAREKFGYLLDAFSYGAPPHGGFGLGIDRVAMILVGGTSIRDVIAFPKTQSGADPLTGAPTPADPQHLKELRIRIMGDDR